MRVKDYSNLCAILQQLIPKIRPTILNHWQYFLIVYIPFSVAESEGGKVNWFLYSPIVNINLERKSGI